MTSMKSYILAVLTLYSLCVSFGKSMPIENTSIANSLNILAKSCANPLITSQINDKIVACNVTSSNDKQGKFDCLLFYDINKQLCQAAKDSRLVVNDVAVAKLQTSNNLEDVCTSAMTWNISNLEDYPHYKSRIDQLIKKPPTCGIVCKGDDIETLDVNFYCKYYSWGVDLLRNIVPEPIDAKKTIENTAAEVIDPDPSGTNSKTVITTTNQVIQPSADDMQINLGQQVESKPHNTDKTVTDGKDINKAIDGTSPLDLKLSNNNDIKVNVKAETASLQHKVNADAGNEGAEKSLVVEKPKLAEKTQFENNVPGNPSDKDDNGFGDGNRPSYNDDETDYNNIDGLEQSNVLQQIPNKKPKIESGLTFNGEIVPQKELVSNTFPEGYGEENDSFFPVFLTGIIMVVLLYVLYHNKSRVSKLVLGLIVEGRQSNRRRNSRGHAYRRLDTLEQAMNTNQSAAPSKIIY